MYHSNSMFLLFLSIQHTLIVTCNQSNTNLKRSTVHEHISFEYKLAKYIINKLTTLMNHTFNTKPHYIYISLA